MKHYNKQNYLRQLQMQRRLDKAKIAKLDTSPITDSLKKQMDEKKNIITPF